MDLEAFPTSSVEGILTLLALPGLGPVRVMKLARQYPLVSDVQSASAADLQFLLPRFDVTLLLDRDQWRKASAEALGILRGAAAEGISVLALTDPTYPALLAAVPDPPPVLYVKGALPSHTRCVACIGTREPSPFASRAARRISLDLAAAGWCIVSGLALGIDAISHRAALEAGGRTVAVLANGLDSVYPRMNAPLAEEIVASGGAIVSEQPFGVRVSARNLVARDRIQSGLSLATIVMQTGLAGGSMHTARFTLEQGRKLFAVPPPTEEADDDAFAGSRALLELNGRQLAVRLKATGRYLRLLQGQFGVVFPARPARDAEELREELEAHPRPPASPAPPSAPPQTLFNLG